MPWAWEFHTARVNNNPMPTESPPLTLPPISNTSTTPIPPILTTPITSIPPPVSAPSTISPAQPLETPPPTRGPRKQLDVYTRTQICTLRNVAGWTWAQIQAHFPHIPKSTLITTVKREKTRHHNQTIRRTGAPKKLNEDDKKKILAALDKDPRITWDDLEKVIDRKAGRHSIRRLIEAAGRRKGPPDRKLIHQKMMAKIAESTSTWTSALSS